MRDHTLEAVAEGERRALFEWQLEHREPCDDCRWTETPLKTWGGEALVVRVRLDACPRHGGRP